MDERIMRLPRPTLWSANNNKPRIATNTQYVNTLSIDSRTGLKKGSNSEHRGVSTQRCCSHSLPDIVQRNLCKYQQKSASPTSILRLTSANLATFDESHSNVHPSSIDATPTRRTTNTTTATTPLNRTNISDEYRLAMDSIIQLSSSPISMPSVHATSAAGDRRLTIDTNSVASSTHFTLVNGFGVMKHQKPIGDGRNSYCCCCKPIAAVIITMTGLLALIVFLMIFIIECKSAVAAYDLNNLQLVCLFFSADPRMTLIVQ